MANKGLIESSDMTIEQKAMTLLACVAQESKVTMERLIRNAGLNLSLLQLNILHALAQAPQGCLTVNQLKSVMLDETPNVSRTLNKLTEMALVTKTRSDEDQRVVFIEITDAGHQAHEAADQELASYQSPLTEKESEQLYKLLNKF